ncbi:MAG: hypothetical protein KatS3mg035_0220 [Bacteroidia bacterium]|nr:MAG: hypothetical protein KatS3mg035_0220 [Bacteroidia bacterium]
MSLLDEIVPFNNQLTILHGLGLYPLYDTTFVDISSHYPNENGTVAPSNKLSSLKLAGQYSFFVSKKILFVALNDKNIFTIFACHYKKTT